MPRLRTPRSVRAGTTATEALLLTGGIVLAGSLTVVIVPRVINASGAAEFVEIMPEEPGRREIVEALKLLVESSAVLIAIQEDAPSRSTDVLLWYEDARDRARINASEVVLLSYSGLLGSITVYTFDSGEPVEVAAAAGISAPDDGVIELASFSGPEFVGRWRSEEGVEGRVIAGGVTDMRIDRAAQDAGEVTLRFSLTWEKRAVDDDLPEACFQVRLPEVQGLNTSQR